MKLRQFSEKEGEITFALENDNTCELIVVNYNVADPILAYKKSLIADTLYMIAHDNAETSWEQIDKMVNKVMNTKIHII